ncbi:MAG: SAM-dependent methyltransferase [Candidatus Omnitrophota bacterium]|jgi:SAM-dependent methyltransferase
MACPLCGLGEPLLFHQSNQAFQNRTFHICNACELVWASPEHRLSAEEEKSRYDLHCNNPEDLDYLDFLNRLAKPMIVELKSDSLGLDYGCGPGPAMQIPFEQAGHRVNLFDPFYYFQNKALDEQYDFITVSEVAEHFFNPSKEFEQFNHLLKPGGILGVMTQLRLLGSKFQDWWYPRDPTHVTFYSQKTMEWIAKQYNWVLGQPRHDICLFSKP